MKVTFFILLLLLALVIFGKYLYDKFIDQPTIDAEIFLNKALTEKKILYKVNYSGVEFAGVYDLNSKEFQDQEQGKYKLKVIKDGMIFGIELLKNNKPVKNIKFDLLQQKLKIKA